MSRCSVSAGRDTNGVAHFAHLRGMLGALVSLVVRRKHGEVRA
ncbi:hypothetical protein [Burkholderia sp. LS-044]|nr:hypothetical protein [Burkholderia sp. LS-044]